MKFLTKCKDGGPDSNVESYVLIEIKSLFSIMLLKFNKGSRDNYHSHAFNALSIYLTGKTTEIVLENNKTPRYIHRHGFDIKKTPKYVLHKVLAHTDSWCLTFRGPWQKTWQEYNAERNETITLKNGRKVVRVEGSKD